MDIPRETKWVDGAKIDVAQDYSINNRDATSTGSSRPTYKTGTMNGLPSALFDGINDYLVSNDVAPPFSGTDKPFSFYIAVKPVATGTDDIIGFGDTTPVSVSAIEL